MKTNRNQIRSRLLCLSGVKTSGLHGLTKVKWPSVETISFYLAHFKSMVPHVKALNSSPSVSLSRNVTFCRVTFSHASLCEASSHLFEVHSQAYQSKYSSFISDQTVVNGNIILIHILKNLIYGNSKLSRHDR